MFLQRLLPRSGSVCMDSWWPGRRKQQYVTCAALVMPVQSTCSDDDNNGIITCRATHGPVAARQLLASG